MWNPNTIYRNIFTMNDVLLRWLFMPSAQSFRPITSFGDNGQPLLIHSEVGVETQALNGPDVSCGTITVPPPCLSCLS